MNFRHPTGLSGEWARIPPGMATTMRSYIEQCALTQRPATVTRNEPVLRELGLFVADRFPDVARVADLRRPHLEAYKTWLAQRPLKRHGKGPTLHRASLRNRLTAIGLFFEPLMEWAADDAPASRLIGRNRRRRSPNSSSYGKVGILLKCIFVAAFVPETKG